MRAEGDRFVDDGSFDAHELTLASRIEVGECGGALAAGVPHDDVGESLGVDEHPATAFAQLEMRRGAHVHTVEESIDAQAIGVVLDERAILAAIARAMEADDLGVGDVVDAKVGVKRRGEGEGRVAGLSRSTSSISASPAAPRETPPSDQVAVRAKPCRGSGPSVANCGKMMGMPPRIAAVPSNPDLPLR